LRALALFRMAMGVLILIDLWMRSRSMEAMYTNAGFIPLDMLYDYERAIDINGQVMMWSLHALSGSLQWQVFLFVVAAVAAALMAVGYRTRVATIVSWVLLVSLQARNPLIVHSGDTLLRVAMFWSMFLPLGAVWSLDARRRIAKSAVFVRGFEVVSPATVGLILTLFSLYFFAGVAKLNHTWFSGMVMEYVSRLDIYSTALGKSLRDYPGLMKVITWSTLVVEVALPFLLFVPWQNRRIRVLLILIFFGFHIGIALTMSLGLFQYVSMCVWLALLPGGFMASLGNRLRLTPPVTQELVRPYASHSVSRTINGVAAFFAVYFLLWNTANIYQVPQLKNAMPPSCQFVGQWLNMRQQFAMFDTPPAYSPWFVFDARLADGSSVDIFRNAPVSYERPYSVLATIPEHHWRRYLRNLVRGEKRFLPFRESTARCVMNHWNATHDKHQKVVSLKVTAFLDEITPYSSEPAGQLVMVWSKFESEDATDGLFDDLLKEMREKGEILP
jgi:Vitamin K-dependent gamma-carboxylase